VNSEGQDEVHSPQMNNIKYQYENKKCQENTIRVTIFTERKEGVEGQKCGKKGGMAKFVKIAIKMFK
jgi:hypothetical protein